MSVLKKIIQRSRLGIYESILNLALKQGYLITSLKDWYEHDFYPEKKVFITRHDVDYDAEGAYKMYQIEKKLGVRSTFYYRWSTMDFDTMKVMHEDDFEVSLHYETLATYARGKKIKSKDELTQKDFANCIQILKKEKELFEEKYWKIYTLCSHGDQRNRLIGVPNFRLLDNENRKDWGIYFEAYDEEIKSKFKAYISDSSIKNNHNWKYGISVEEAIKTNISPICLLTHPQHWNYHFQRNIKKVYTDTLEFFFRT